MSSSKKRQTMAKITRERAVKEKRARKQEKKDEKKLAAAEARAAEANGEFPSDIDDENPVDDLEATEPPERLTPSGNA
jgi:hypothetical protein